MPLNNFTHFFPTTKAAAPGFMLAMNPVPRQHPIASLETATFGRSQKPVPIKCIVERFIQRTHPVPSGTGKEHAGLVNEIGHLESGFVERVCSSLFAGGAPILEQFAAAIENHRFVFASGQRVGYHMQCIVPVEIIAIEPAQDDAGGPLEPLINRLSLSMIRFASPVSKLLFSSPDHRDALIRATPIHHQIF